MSYVQQKAEELRKNGIYGAEGVDPDTISKIINMAEWDYYDIDVILLESYLGVLAQQVYFLQQETNKAEALEIEMGNAFKIKALPEVLDSKIRSVEERWIYASTLHPDLELRFDRWQKTIIEATLKKKLSEPMTEKLNVLKKIYDDRRQEGRNKNLQKYSENR